MWKTHTMGIKWREKKRASLGGILFEVKRIKKISRKFSILENIRFWYTFLLATKINIYTCYDFTNVFIHLHSYF